MLYSMVGSGLTPRWTGLKKLAKGKHSSLFYAVKENFITLGTLAYANVIKLLHS
jgi:hypothetical protein